MRLSGLILYLFFLGGCLYGQTFNGNFLDTIGSNSTLSESETILKYFTIKDRTTRTPVEDTIFADFEKYDPAKRFSSASLGLGNLGSAQLSVRLKGRESMNTVVGLNQYDIYKLDPDDIRFYEQNRPFNDLYFSPVAGQNNFAVGAQFSRNFDKNVNVSLDFKRYTQEGFYQNQKTKSTAFGIGIWKANPEKNHDLFFRFTANNHNEEINGGVATDTLFDRDLFRLRTAIPVRLMEDTTRHQHFSYSLDNYFDAVNDRLGFHHKIQYETGYFRYGDMNTSTLEDTLVYGDFLVESRGLRYFTGFNRINNDIDLAWTQKIIDIKIGLSHSHQRYSLSEDLSVFNDVTTWGELGFNIGDFSRLSGRLDIGIGDNAGNLNLDGKIQVDGIKNLKFSSFLNIERYDASLIERQLIISDQLIYDNEFSKVNNFEIGGTLEWETADLKIKFKSGVRDNAIAFDSLARPYQLSGSLEYIQAELEHKWQWKFVGMENSILYQTFSDNIYNLPRVYSIHNIYFQFRLFKRRLLTQTGLLYYNIDYDGGFSFMPLNGAFAPVDQEPARYHYTEFYANFKIDRFRLFFKVDNLTELWQREIHYQVNDYPMFDYKMRIGVRWQMYD